MKNLYFMKRAGVLIPYGEPTIERMKKVKEGSLVNGEFVVPRNEKFHRKFFALLNYAFQFWEPDQTPVKGLIPQKDIERFREEVTIMAGYRYVVSSLKTGEVRYQAKSISFGKMEEEEFHSLYKSVFNVLWELVLSKVPTMTEEQVHNAINIMMEFE